MTHFTLKVVFLINLTIILPRPSLGQQLTQNLTQTVWGAASNGVCVGIYVAPGEFPHKNDFECCMELGNLTTNLLWIWFPPLEQRYDIEMWGPDGRRIHQLKPLFWSQKTPWSGLRPLSTNSTSASLDWFFLKDTFDVQTNGLYTLIASVRVNVFTNFIVGQLQMHSDPTYFLLPPVTNTFNVSPIALRK